MIRFFLVVSLMYFLARYATLDILPTVDFIYDDMINYANEEVSTEITDNTNIDNDKTNLLFPVAEILESIIINSLEEELESADPEAKKYSKIIKHYWNFMHNRDDVKKAINVLVDNLFDELNITENDEEAWWRLGNSCIDAGITSNGNLGYAIHDINNDSIPELIILSDKFFVFAIYTLVNDKPILVDAFWGRYNCEIDENNTLYIHASNGGVDGYWASYLVEPNTLEFLLVKIVGVESYDETAARLNSIQYYRIENGSKDIINEEEALIEWEKFWDKSTKNAGLVFMPLF